MGSGNAKACRPCRRKLAAVAVVGALAVTGWFGRGRLLQSIGDFLVRDDHPGEPAADYLVLLQGDDTGVRAETACQAYKSGRARHILFFEEIKRGFVRMDLQRSGAEVHAAYLRRCGVPAADLLATFDCPTDSTVDEARCSHAYFMQRGGLPHRIILVTSWYHSARAGWLFDRMLDGVQVDVVPASNAESHVEGWWQDKYGLLSVTNEYLKWAFWLIKQPKLEPKAPAV